MEQQIDKKRFEVKSSNGKTALQCTAWMPAQPLGVVQLVHGMQEYVGRYEAFARYLAEKGLVVAGHDQLGHGSSVNSNEDLGYFGDGDSAQVLEADIHLVNRKIREVYPHLPLILFGHSFGSYLLRDYIASYPVTAAGVILSGCGMQSMATVNSARMIGRVLKFFKGARYRSPLMNRIAFGHYLDRIEHPITEKDWLSHNTEENRRYIANPKCNYTFTLNGFFTIGDLVERTQDPKRMAKIPKDLPILLVSGAEDPVGDYGEAVRRIYKIYKEDLGLHHVNMMLYPGFRHELLQETGRSQVFEDLREWIEKKCFNRQESRASFDK